MEKLSIKLDQTLNYILLKAENQHELLIGDCRSDVKVTNTQEHILMLLSEKQLTNSELAKHLHISQAAVTKAVKSLVRMGLLETQKDTKDARVTYFVLTDEARPIAEEHRHHHEETLGAYGELLQRYSNSEKSIIYRFLDDLSKELGES